MKSLIAKALTRIVEKFFQDTNLGPDSTIIQILAVLIILAGIFLCIAFIVSMYKTFIRKRK
jgi:hypothetical protein